MPDFSTGFAQLPDVGTLAYNGADFSSLFTSHVTVTPIRDRANRTVTMEELTIRARGCATLRTGETTTDNAMAVLLVRLQQDGGQLFYSGKGVGRIAVNVPAGGQPRQGQAGTLTDCNWGPKTKVVSFQPLGGSKSALVEWEVTTWLPPGMVSVAAKAKGVGPVLQFNEEITTSYDENAYATYAVAGTLEIPLTRLNVGSRSVATTVDAYRQAMLDIKVDLTRYRVTKRDFKYSRDKRTCEWEFVAEQLPPMALPPGIPTARGTFTVRPRRQAQSLVPIWNCSLRCSYVVRPDGQRRWAWDAFMCLLAYRMAQSANGDAAKFNDPSPQGQQPKPGVGEAVLKTAAILGVGALTFGVGSTAAVLGIAAGWQKIMGGTGSFVKGALTQARTISPILYHFGIDEGLYLDSKSISFEASWWITTSLQRLLDATGVWRQLELGPTGNRQFWALSLQDITGWRGALVNALDPAKDVVIDLGGP